MKTMRTVFMLAVVHLGAGCAGPMFEGTIFEQPSRQNPAVAGMLTNAQQMSVEIRQLSEQVAALNRNQESFETRMSRFETQAGTTPQTQDDIIALRRDMQLLRAERESLKKEITDDLAVRIEKIAARQQADINAARNAAAASPVTGRASNAGKASVGARSVSGYEHKVERGQTLSEIARGYGKSMDVILKANKITNPSTIRVGQILFIPD
ncbi:MAG: LysM peptidoglycan-binding domain-containing protein [Kiritimatiellae bacterium]|nr:LysM peptidoglycan-binding domain-containing protein [Kiritimatiellia bacterium]